MRTRCVLHKVQSAGRVVFAAMAMFHSSADAVTSPGWRELAVQVPDINLRPGAKAYVPIELKTVELDNTLPTDSGLFAMSTVPGLSIVSAYGFATPTLQPPNVWTPIGEAEPWIPGSNPWFGNHRGTRGISIVKFAVSFDGTAPDGTQASVLIAINEAGDVGVVPRVIGTINVYVDAVPKTSWFTIRSSSANISGHHLILNHAYLNGNSNAKVFVSHVYSTSGPVGVYWNHPISVAYNYQLNRWTIQNDDNANMLPGLSFHVRIDPGASVVKSPNWRVIGNTSFCAPYPAVPAVPISHPSANYNPYATIVVTPRSADPSPLAVKYVAPRWYIVHKDGSQMPACGEYNVKVIGFSEYAGFTALLDGAIDLFVSNGAGMSIQGGGAVGPRTLPFWWQLGGGGSQAIIVTANLTPPAAFYVTVVPDPGYIGVSFTGPNLPGERAGAPAWQIVHEDGTPVPMQVTFNVWGVPQLTP